MRILNALLVLVTMELVTLVNSYLNLFRFFGICVQTPGMSSYTKIFSYSASILAIIYVIPLAPILYFLTKPYKVTEIVDYIQCLCIYFTHLVLTIETLCTRNSQLRFWYYVKKTEGLYLNNIEDVTNAYAQFKKPVFQKILILLALSIVLEGYLVINYIVYKEQSNAVIYTLLPWLLNIYSVMAGRARHMSHILAIEILKMHIEIFNNSLIRLNRKFKKLDNTTMIEELNFIKFRHTFIWELCKSVNSCYICSQFVNIFVNFFQITCVSFYVYHMFADGSFAYAFRKKNIFITNLFYFI